MCFADKTKIICNPITKVFGYIEKIKNLEIVKYYKLNEYSRIIEKKVVLFKKYMALLSDVKNKNKKNRVELVVKNLEEKIRNKSVNDEYYKINQVFVHLKKWIYATERKAVLFRLSNSMFQFIFADESEIRLKISKSSKIGFYINRKGKKEEEFSLWTVTKTQSENTDFIQRYNYVKNELIKLAKKEIYNK